MSGVLKGKGDQDKDTYRGKTVRTQGEHSRPHTPAERPQGDPTCLCLDLKLQPPGWGNHESQLMEEWALHYESQLYGRVGALPMVFARAA